MRTARRSSFRGDLEDLGASRSAVLSPTTNLQGASWHQEAVGKDSGLTNHVERWNNTLRQRLGQFVRKTLSFSKSWDLHVARLKLFVHRYNLEIAENILK